jgi:hypothetical protein
MRKLLEITKIKCQKILKYQEIEEAEIVEVLEFLRESGCGWNTSTMI